jgi:hypothetical protein
MVKFDKVLVKSERKTKKLSCKKDGSFLAKTWLVLVKSERKPKKLSWMINRWFLFGGNMVEFGNNMVIFGKNMLGFG